MASAVAVTSATMLLGALIGLAGAAALAGVGRAFSTRAGARGAEELRFFALLWYGAAGALAADATLTFLLLAGWATLPMVTAVMGGRILLPLLALFGFAAYLSIVYTGSKRWLLPLGGVLAAVYLGILGVAATFHLTGATAQTWRGWYTFTTTPGGAAYLAADAASFLPPLLLTAAYARLVTLAPDAEARWRIAWIAPALSAYFTGQLVGLMAFGWSGFAILEGVLACATGVSAWIGIRPPAWAKPRLRRAPWTPRSGLQTLMPMDT